MALVSLQFSYFTSKPHPHICKSVFPLPTKPKVTIIISQDSSQSSKPTIEEQPRTTKKPLSSGQGFGPGSGSTSTELSKSNPSVATGKKKQKGRRERASIIRRSPLEKPAFLDKKGEEVAKEPSVNESAFLLAWLGLGGVILVEGITLAASGFLPEQWDKFFVKFLYPSFTPTIFVFFAGTVAYGVFKYLQNENLRNQK
ncbi:hypothetical protein Cgig2_013567 [Carnegiea gigantea]|uniref:Protein LOW PSII ACCUMULATION 2, chloroplastic n=1 Tax=Carnegiea gigantea TaxID=171969 RepID=A0A9Q1GY31_9CARY|nr:hypothetical protein Cgig2_013567 [Carnegiea gigantea]